MGTYYCEGFIKEVKVAADGEVSFTLEPAAPYLFEKKENDGKTKRLLLLVDDPQKPNGARVLGNDEEPTLSAPSKCDLSAMLIAKANHLKIRVISNLASVPISVEELAIL